MAGQYGSSYTRLELAEKEHSVVKCGGIWATIAVAQHSQEDYAMRQRREREWLIMMDKNILMEGILLFQ